MKAQRIAGSARQSMPLMSLGQPWQIHQPHLLVSGKQTRGIPGWGIGRQGLALVGALLIVLVWSQPEASSTNHTGSSLESRCHSAMNGSLGYYSRCSDMVGCFDLAWCPSGRPLLDQNSTIEESLDGSLGYYSECSDMVGCSGLANPGGC